MHIPLLFLLAAPLISSHFVLQIPTSLGFDDDAEVEAPCGGFNAYNRTGASNFAIKGSTVAVLTTHLSVTFEFRAALLSNLNNWVPLTKVLNQTGVGDFCEPQIPGKANWVGKKGVLQVIQHGPDGTLYQCAAVKFVNGGPVAPPADCTNSTGTAAHWV